jgi:hypothetical protein
MSPYTPTHTPTWLVLVLVLVLLVAYLRVVTERVLVPCGADSRHFVCSAHLNPTHGHHIRTPLV